LRPFHRQVEKSRRKVRKAKRLCFLLAIVCLFKAHTGFAQDAVSYFQKGMAAFNSQAYEQALEYFQKAQALNLTDKRLHYNLGATYFKLGRYAPAYDAFEQASTNNQLASLSHYNKALCALKLNNQSAAVESLRLAYDSATTDQERWLAEKKLNQLGHTLADKRTIVAATALVSLGYNDNVTLNVIEDAAQSGKADRYAAYSAKLDLDLSEHWELGGKLYGVHYQELKSYNYDNLSAALTYTSKLTAVSQPLELLVGGVFDRSFLEGDGMLDTASATVTLRYALLTRSLSRQSNLQVKYTWSDIRNLQERFAYLKGNMSNLDISSRLQVVKSLLKLSYQYETNQRENFTMPGSYTDFSPSRHKIAFSHTLPVMKRTSMEWGAGYRNSKYQNANQLSDTKYVLRTDDRFTAALRLLYKVTRHAWIVAAYQYLDNRSNIATYTYTANNYSLSVVWH